MSIPNRVENPFELLFKELEQIKCPLHQIAAAIQELDQRLKAVEQKTQHDENKPRHIPLRVFCHELQISRPTAYAWAEKGLIKMEKIGTRQYVLEESIIIDKKYQRKPVE